MANAGRERGGVLLLRVWVEPGLPGLRARLVGSTDGEPASIVTVAAAAGIDDICTAMRTWLEHLTPPSAGGDGAVTAD
jgi:hypothetical protein